MRRWSFGGPPALILLTLYCVFKWKFEEKNDIYRIIFGGNATWNLMTLFCFLKLKFEEKKYHLYKEFQKVCNLDSDDIVLFLVVHF